MGNQSSVPEWKIKLLSYEFEKYNELKGILSNLDREKYLSILTNPYYDFSRTIQTDNPTEAEVDHEIEYLRQLNIRNQQFINNVENEYRLRRERVAAMTNREYADYLNTLTGSAIDRELRESARYRREKEKEERAEAAKPLCIRLLEQAKRNPYISVVTYDTLPNDAISQEPLQNQSIAYMVNDVISSVYEYNSLQKWFQKKCTDPNTNLNVNKISKVQIYFSIKGGKKRKSPKRKSLKRK